MQTKLILVEGIPGSGKTTTAQFVHTWCEQHEIVSRLYLEGNWNHPADYEWVACLSHPEYEALLNRFGAYKEFLEQHVAAHGADLCFSYRQLPHEYGQSLPGALFDHLAGYEVYELALEQYKRLILERWSSFVAQTLTTNTIYIFECCFLQNPPATLIGRHGEDIRSARTFVAHLASVIAPLQPGLIYLNPTDSGLYSGPVRLGVLRCGAPVPDLLVGFVELRGEPALPITNLRQPSTGVTRRLLHRPVDQREG